MENYFLHPYSSSTERSITYTYIQPLTKTNYTQGSMNERNIKKTKWKEDEYCTYFDWVSYSYELTKLIRKERCCSQTKPALIIRPAMILRALNIMKSFFFLIIFCFIPSSWQQPIVMWIHFLTSLGEFFIHSYSRDIHLYNRILAEEMKLYNQAMPQHTAYHHSNHTLRTNEMKLRHSKS